MAKKRKITHDVTEMIPAPAQPQLITDTIEKNFMPYAMSVIVSRAIPEIDGFKPAHRKLLYTMYKMGLLTGSKTKSANVVGQTMKLNPHGDASIYETLVRLTRGNETLLHPFIDSKGSFGKQYSSDMKYAASRYTECKLDTFCNEIFSGIDKDAVDFVDNYDGTMKEPTLLPTTFPNILVTPNTGIAVGMASNICSFNLAEVCDGTIALLKNPKVSLDRMMEIIKAPDFPGGGAIIYDREKMREIFLTGQGSVRVRSRYNYDKDANCIDILQIPYSTSIEQIMQGITDLIKDGKLKEVTDFRDEIDLSGFKLTIDLRRGTDPDKLMSRLFKLTKLEDSFKCNFNVLIDSVPRQLGIIDILNEWIRFRIGCVKRELTFDLNKKKDKLHLLMGLAKILLDIDKAIRIIRQTEKESDVVPNLMKGFDIDEIQAEYIAEIKLRHLNREYILNRVSEIEGLQKEIAELEELLGDELKIKAYIASQLLEVKKKYGKPRRSQIIGAEEISEYNEEDHIEAFNGTIVLTREGYFKKISQQSLRLSDNHMLKDGDEIICTIETDNNAELVFFTDRAQVYRAKVSDFDPVKASVMGDFIPAKLNMDAGERPVFLRVQNSYPAGDNMVFVFENGKAVRISVANYETKGNRRKLTGAFSTASPIVAVFYEPKNKPFEIMLISSADRALVVKTSQIAQMSTRTSGGNSVMTLKKGQTVVRVLDNFSEKYGDAKGYRKLKLPSSGMLLTENDIKAQQLKIDQDN
ncbi:MAG: DNA gyrase subunit A [Eubacteriales bacterium]|nr:DNA gyrase subunit A [Eubacteriales bacterium]